MLTAVVLRINAAGRRESAGSLLGDDAIHLEGGRHDVVDVVVGRGLLGQLRRPRPRFAAVHQLLHRRRFRQSLLPPINHPIN